VREREEMVELVVPVLEPGVLRLEDVKEAVQNLAAEACVKHHE
jgi:hypothetical protein